MKKSRKFLVLAVVMSLFATMGLVAQEADVAAAAAEPAAAESAEAQVVVEAEVVAQEEAGSDLKYVAAGLAVGLACIGAGLAVGYVGAAAVGAMSENEGMSGKAMPFVGLAEGICLWGFLVALLIIL